MRSRANRGHRMIRGKSYAKAVAYSCSARHLVERAALRRGATPLYACGEPPASGAPADYTPVNARAATPRREAFGSAPTSRASSKGVLFSVNKRTSGQVGRLEHTQEDLNLPTNDPASDGARPMVEVETSGC